LVSQKPSDNHIFRTLQKSISRSNMKQVTLVKKTVRMRSFQKYFVPITKYYYGDNIEDTE